MPARQADTQGKGWEQGRRGAAPPEVRGAAGPPPGRMRPRQLARGAPLAHRRAGLRIRSSHRWCRRRCAARRDESGNGKIPYRPTPYPV
jgi:hypothetical protein